MNVLIKKVKIIDSQSQFHNQIFDVEIFKGKIRNIAVDLPLPADCTVIEIPNLHLSPGWFDTSVSLGEPGFEDRETIENGLNVAAKSGFTAVALQPNSYPVIDNQSQIQFVKSKAQNSSVELFQIGRAHV